MRLLIINDFYKCGGAEYIANLQYQIMLECYEDAWLLTFDANLKNGWIDDRHYNLKMSGSKVKKIINKLIFNPIVYFRIICLLRMIRPDFVLLHSFISTPITQYFALYKQQVIQTVHDYFYICPKFDCLKPDKTVCTGMKYNCCIKSECRYDGSRLKLMFYIIHSKMLIDLRRHIVKGFISPSKCLSDHLIDHGYRTQIINNPYIYEEYIPVEKENGSFLYVGKISEQKGIYEFINAFKCFALDKKVRLSLIGAYQTPSDEKKLSGLIEDNEQIKYLGEMDHQNVLRNIKRSRYLVVPSLWMENYATVILEAFSNKTVVCASDRGGNREMLENGRGIIFDILSLKDITEKLEGIVGLSDVQYDEICDRGYKYVVENNSRELYYHKIKKVLSEV